MAMVVVTIRAKNISPVTSDYIVRLGLDTEDKFETCPIRKISCVERICIKIYNIYMPQSYQVILSSIPYSKQQEKNKRAGTDI